MTKKRKKINLTQEDITQLLEEYKVDEDDLFDEKTEYQIRILREFNLLPPAQRIIFLIYSETKSMMQTAKILGCGYKTKKKEIKIIQNKIKDRLKI